MIRPLKIGRSRAEAIAGRPSATTAFPLHPRLDHVQVGQPEPVQRLGDVPEQGVRVRIDHVVPGSAGCRSARPSGRRRRPVRSPRRPRAAGGPGSGSGRRRRRSGGCSRPVGTGRRGTRWPRATPPRRNPARPRSDRPRRGRPRRPAGPRRRPRPGAGEGASHPPGVDTGLRRVRPVCGGRRTRTRASPRRWSRRGPSGPRATAARRRTAAPGMDGGDDAPPAVDLGVIVTGPASRTSRGLPPTRWSPRRRSGRPRTPAGRSTPPSASARHVAGLFRPRARQRCHHHAVRQPHRPDRQRA